MIAVRQNLRPHEVARRRAAWERYFTHSACLRAPDTAMAGATSAPVAQEGLLHRVNSPARATAPAVFWPVRSVAVSYEHARAWAVAHGLAQPRRALDLRAVNAFRAARGLAPFWVRMEA